MFRKEGGERGRRKAEKERGAKRKGRRHAEATWRRSRRRTEEAGRRGESTMRKEDGGKRKEQGVAYITRHTCWVECLCNEKPGTPWQPGAADKTPAGNRK